MARAGAGRRTGRRPGQPDTRQEILAAARDLFSRRGFTDTSIRAVARSADVDPSLVHHYFGSKEGLFRASLEIPIEPEVLIEHVFAGGIEEAPARLVETFLTVWDGADTGPAMVGLLRRVVANQAQGEMLREFIGTVVVRASADKLIGHGGPEEPDLRIGLVTSHLLGVMMARKVLLIEPVASMPAERLAALLTPTIGRYLLGELPPALVHPPPSERRNGFLEIQKNATNDVFPPSA